MPSRAPSVCVAGAIATAYGGAIGVTVGEPLVDGPSADVALKPSSTIDVVFDFNPGSINTRRCTAMLPPAAIDKPVHVAVPPALVPPLPAKTKLVFAGTGSVTVTPVAAALPMLRTVIV